MLAVTRYTVAPPDAGDFLERAQAALGVLAAQRGYRAGRVGRATDDPTRWVLVTEWAGVGAYRRALSAYDVKVAAVPLLSLAEDEPTAYEVIVASSADGSARAGTTGLAADAGSVAVGEASGPGVATDLD